MKINLPKLKLKTRAKPVALSLYFGIPGAGKSTYAAYRDMSIGAWRGLDGNNWLFQLPAKPVGVDCAENLLQIPRCSDCLDSLFHVLPSLSQNKVCAQRSSLASYVTHKTHGRGQNVKTDRPPRDGHSR